LAALRAALTEGGRPVAIVHTAERIRPPFLELLPLRLEALSATALPRRDAPRLVLKIASRRRGRPFSRALPARELRPASGLRLRSATGVEVRPVL
jgi:hypothetical protein